MNDNDFGSYLASLRCDEAGCERQGDHHQGGRTVCSAHIDNSRNAPRTFCAND